jgi:hypothetical protein
METNDFIVGLIKQTEVNIKEKISDFCNINSSDHKSINTHLSELNGSVKKIKRQQLILRGILIGVVGTLAVLGLLPERLWNLIKSAF